MKNKQGFSVFKFLGLCAQLIAYTAYERAKDWVQSKTRITVRPQEISVTIKNSGLTITKEIAKQVQFDLQKSMDLFLAIGKIKELVTCGDSVNDYFEECCLSQELVKCGGEIPESDEVLCSVDSCGECAALFCGIWDVKCERQSEN